MKRHNKDYIQNRSNEIHNGEYEIIGEFKDMNSKCLAKHKLCGYEWELNLNNHIYKRKGCPKCYGNLKKSLEELQEISNIKYDNEYIIMDFKSTVTFSNILHLKCATVFSCKLSSHIYGDKKCDKCFKYNNEKSTIDELKRKCFNLHGDKYSILSSEYINTNSKVKIRHNICKNEWLITPANMLKGKGCPRCNKKEKLTKEYIQNKSNELHNSEYIILGDYINSDIPILTKHIKCNHEWNMYIGAHLNKLRLVGCPNCNKSLGERKIEEILKNNKIKFYSQYKFEDCAFLKKLIFDFYLPDYNVCIEYDGEQHFKPVKYFGGIDKFNKQIKNDEIKNHYCLDNNISLLRIPYLDYKNIEQILNSYLSNFII